MDVLEEGKLCHPQIHSVVGRENGGQSAVGEKVSSEGSGRLSRVDLVPSQGSARVPVWPEQVILGQDSQHLHA